MPCEPCPNRKSERNTVRQETSTAANASLLRADAEFRRLRQMVMLGEGFQLLIVISDAPRVIRTMLWCLEEDVPQLSGTPTTVLLLDPYTETGGSAATRLTAEQLIERILTPLVYPPEAPRSERLLVTINGSAATDADAPAWQLLFQRMNERRNSLVRRVAATLLLCVTPRLYTLFAHVASDFWSIRRAIITLDTATLQPELREPRMENRLGDSQDVVLGPWAGTVTSVEAVVAARRRAEAFPNDLPAAEALSVQLRRWGDFRMTSGDTSGALAAYQEALQIDQRLATQDSANAQWQRDLAVSHNKVGDVLVAQGQLGEALRAYTASRVIAEQLATQDSANAQWQRDLAVSHIKVGNVLVAQGQLGEALRSYTASRVIAEQLATQDSANAQWQRDLAVSYFRLGEVARRSGELATAMDYFMQARAISARLVERDPTNAVWKNDLAWVNQRIDALKPK